jgi:general secretion pathway protein D
MLEAVMSDSRTKIQQSPEVRVSDGQKVTLKIGEKYPYATGSYTSSASTVSPLVSTQFQFVDIGVNVEITPHVHAAGEVTLHVSVDISNVANTVTLGGLSQPVIGQKKDETDIRLKDGEVSLLGGLMSDQETSVVGGIPGLVNIPLLGKYLGNTSKDRQKEQLMIALIPHIVRKREITGLDLKGIAAGTDQEVKLTYSPGAQESTPTATAYTATVPASPAPNNAAVTPSSSGAAPGLVFDPVKVPAPVGSQVKLALRAENIADLAIVRVKLQWDPMVLRLETISPGPLLTEEGTVVVPSVDIRNDTGDATIDVNRATGVGKVNGTDPLLQLTFTAMAKGTTTVAVTEASLKTSKQQPIAVQPPSVAVTTR